VSDERFSRNASLGDYTTVKLLDGDAFRREIGFLVCGTERLNRCPFTL
jgi:hypothetical protein